MKWLVDVLLRHVLPSFGGSVTLIQRIYLEQDASCYDSDSAKSWRTIHTQTGELAKDDDDNYLLTTGPDGTVAIPGFILSKLSQPLPS